MNYLLRSCKPQLAACLVTMLVLPASQALAEPISPLPGGASLVLPQSPGAMRTQQAQSTPTTTPSQNAPAAPVPSQQQSSTPLGTAAAPDEQPAGVAASRPSGAAIAPGKQRRIRTYEIRAALLIGAAVAIGVVAGASLASPARAAH